MSISKQKQLLRLRITVVIIVLIAVALFVATNKQAKTPEAVFQKSLELALSTSQLEQKTEGVKHGTPPISATMVVKYDVTNPQDAKVTYTIAQGNYEAESYATSKDTFVKYKKLDREALGLPEGFNVELNTWIQIRKNGVTIGSDAFSIAPPDPRANLIGHFTFGNLSVKQRSDLLSLIKTNKLYKYDPESVSTSTFEGKEVYVYRNVTFNTATFREYTKKVAGIFNISEDEIQSILKNGDGVDKVKLYIAKDSRRLLKAETTYRGATITVTYSNFNTVKFPPKPKIETTQ